MPGLGAAHVSAPQGDHHWPRGLAVLVRLVRLVWLHHHLSMSAVTVASIDPVTSVTVSSMPMTDMAQPPLT